MALCLCPIGSKATSHPESQAFGRHARHSKLPSESFVSPERKDQVCAKRPVMELPLPSFDDCFKSPQPIHEGLVAAHRACGGDLNRFKASMFVQRTVNDVSFVAKPDEGFPVEFQLEPGTTFRVCIFQCSARYKGFTLLKRENPRDQPHCTACQTGRQSKFPIQSQVECLVT